MSELGDELHRLADEGAERARPLPPSEVIRRGDQRRHRRILSGAVATVAVAGVITAGVVVGVAGGGGPAPAPPATRPVPATAQATPQASFCTADEHAPPGTDRYLTVGGRPADAFRLAIGSGAVEDPLARARAAAPEISEGRRAL